MKIPVNAIVLLMILITLLQPWATKHDKYQLMGRNSQVDFNSGEDYQLAAASINLILISNVLTGTKILATLNYMLAVSEEFVMVCQYHGHLIVYNGIGSASVVGLGWDEMRHYTFVNFSENVGWNHWKTQSPGWITFRPDRPAWTTTGVELDGSGITYKENLTRIRYTGYVSEIEDLAVYFDDGTSFLCGPHIITVGMNFTQIGENVWETESILEVSDDANVTIEENNMIIKMQNPVPLHPALLPASIFAVVACAVSLGIIKKKHLLSKRN